jgi:hypothetical protein
MGEAYSRRQKRYRLDVLVESDRDEEQLAMFIEGVLAQQIWHFEVKDLALYEVTHIRSHVERDRGD